MDFSQGLMIGTPLKGLKSTMESPKNTQMNLAPDRQPATGDFFRLARTFNHFAP
jgi:hypothetical protein